MVAGVGIYSPVVGLLPVWVSMSSSPMLALSVQWVAGFLGSCFLRIAIHINNASRAFRGSSSRDCVRSIVSASPAASVNWRVLG